MGDQYTHKNLRHVTASVVYTTSSRSQHAHRVTGVEFIILTLSCIKDVRKEIFYKATLEHILFMVIWLSTVHITREETHCHHFISYSFQSADIMVHMIFVTPFMKHWPE